MTAELQKRFEEAADAFADKHGFRVPYDGSNNFYDTTDVKASKDGFLAGAELGYKEARQVFVEKACEFLKMRLFPSVKVLSAGEVINVINRSDLIEEFKKIMEEKK